MLDVSLLYTSAAVEEEQGRIAAARDLFERAAREAAAKLQAGARNAGLAAARLKAFEARHPVEAKR